MNEVIQKQTRSLIAGIRIICHHLAHDGRDFFGDTAVERSRIGRRFALMIKELLQGRAFRIWRLSRQHMVHRAAKRINIAAFVCIPRVARLLRRNVVKRTKCGSGDRDVADGIRRVAPRQSQINDLHTPRIREHDIGWLDIAMHNSCGCRMIECERHLNGVVDRIGWTQPPAFHNQITNRATTREFVRDEIHPVLTACVIYPRNIVVVQLRTRSGFVSKTRDERSVLR